jgi:hypothetical protein
MSDRLSNFLIDLATDSDLLARYTADPAGELERAHLTAVERAAVLTGNSARLRQALGVGPADHMSAQPIFKKKPGKKAPGRKPSKRAKKGAQKRGGR